MAQENESEIIYHWSNMHGNPYSRKIDIGMLLDTGLIVEQKAHLKGEPVKTVPAKYRKFRFDVTFVEAQLNRLILKPLHCNNLSELQSRIDKAKSNYEDYKCSLLK